MFMVVLLMQELISCTHEHELTV